MSAESVQESTWHRDFTTLMRCDAGDGWLPEVEAQVASWLREKRLDLRLDGDHDLVETDRRVSVRRDDVTGAADFRLTMSEDTPLGTWVTELVAHDEVGSDDWIHLSVTNSLGKFVDVPRLAKYLMNVLPLGDGTVDFQDQPRALGSPDIERLIDVLIDGERHGLVLVAGTEQREGIPLAAFTTKVGEWTRQVYGLAQVVVLDPTATHAFNDRVGARFEAPPWTIRTYQPAVNFSDINDARRHRILGTGRLGTRSDHSTRMLLGDIARGHAALRETSPSVQRVRRRFERLENRRLLAAVTAVPIAEPETTTQLTQPPHAETTPQTFDSGPDGQVHPDPPQDLGEHTDQLALVRRILGLRDLTETALNEVVARITRGTREREQVADLGRRVEVLQERLEHAEDDNREVREALDQEQLAHQVALLDVDDREARIGWLESRLKESGDYEATYAVVPTEFYGDRPTSFEAMLDRINEMTGVSFTGDLDDVARLNAVDTNDAALRTAWDAVQFLAGYVQARASGEWDLGLKQYVLNTPTGRPTFPPGKFAETETAATMKQFGDERVFPVPTDIDPSGSVVMKAHFKLARIGMASPRMHIHDAHPQHPVVCIGYLGHHKTNTQSN